MRRALAALVVSAALVRPALAQTAAPSARPDRAVSPVVHYGKWGAALLFAGFTALGALEHAQANDAFDDLQSFCRTGGSCSIGGDGRYANPVAESRYQRVVSSDRAARTWLVSGQVALAGAAALFVVELLRERGTKNIPFQGLTVRPAGAGARVGWTVHF